MPSTHGFGQFVERLRRVAMRVESLCSSPAGGRLRPTAAGGLLAVLASAAVSIASAQVLGDSVRIRWSVGTYYGPEYAPTAAALACFPAVVAVTYVGLRTLGTVLEGTTEFDRHRGYYELCALAVLTVLVLVQIAFVAANLW
ncbi:hypothetical protein CP556_09655 [Natrinema sp. CBA1119]|uniref:hypothetical protein n=1 Tax=Natrinema sp. CBA1119 TaxID=1608465 RepID=UPI000BF8B505|nr:hypothetical protein [Natrinema sp. CBA1119]PGF16352.1 hypothetical protein CP556_09655 [Natrinema sp. CBA1119]